ncbi:MAG: CHAT domain-containing protein, partial [Salibacteraceae bacterium]
MQFWVRWLMAVGIFLSFSGSVLATAENEQAANHWELVLQTARDSASWLAVQHLAIPELTRAIEQGQATTLLQMARSLSKALRSNPSEAIQFLKDFSRQCDSASLSLTLKGKLRALAGNELKRQGRFFEALSFFEAGLEALNADRCNDGFHASVYHYTGNIYTRQGNYQQALAYLNQSYALRSQQQDEQGMARSLADLALVYIDLKAYERAGLELRKGLALTQVSKKQKGNLLYNYAFLCHQQAKSDSAAYWNRQAATVYQQAKYTAGLGAVAKLRAQLLEDQNRIFEAIEAYQEALSATVQVRGKRHREVAKIHLAMYAIFREVQDTAEALTACLGALESLGLQEIDSPLTLPPKERLYPEPWLIPALLALAEQWQWKGQHLTNQHQSLLAYQRIGEVTDLLRASYRADPDRSALLQRHREGFESGIALAFSLSEAVPQKRAEYLAIGFELSERSRAYNLHRAILQNQTGNQSPAADSLLELLRLTEAQVHALRQESFQHEKEQSSSWNSQQLDAQVHRQQALEKALKNQFPEVYRQIRTPEVRSMQAVQQQLEDTQMLLEVFKGQQQRTVFALTNDSVVAYQIDHYKGLDSLAQRFRLAVSTPPGKRNQSKDWNEFTQPGYQLYRLLLKPALRSAHDSVRQLILLPDPDLAALPLDLCLMQPAAKGSSFQDLPYLLRHYTVSFHYSASLRASMHQQTYSNTSLQQMLFVGPEFDQSGAFTQKEVQQLSAEVSASELPGSEVELTAASHYFGGEFLLGQAATPNAVKSLIRPGSLLHFSSHAKANFETPLQSYLSLAKTESTAPPEKLSAKDIHGLSLPAGLVVLSACETGVGQGDPGEGTRSLGRAFLYAGSQSVIMQLWSVDDRQSAQLIARFYEYLANGKSVPKALQEAKLQALSTADPLTAHP